MDLCTRQNIKIFLLGVNRASISLIPPSCYSEYQVLVTSKDSCCDALDCLNSPELKCQSGRIDEFQKKISIEINGLVSCSQYRAIFKAKGGCLIKSVYHFFICISCCNFVCIEDKNSSEVVSEAYFWTLPEMRTAFRLDRFTVR